MNFIDIRFIFCQWQYWTNNIENMFVIVGHLLKQLMLLRPWKLLDTPCNISTQCQQSVKGSSLLRFLQIKLFEQEQSTKWGFLETWASSPKASGYQSLHNWCCWGLEKSLSFSALHRPNANDFWRAQWLQKFAKIWMFEREQFYLMSTSQVMKSCWCYIRGVVGLWFVFWVTCLVVNASGCFCLIWDGKCTQQFSGFFEGFFSLTNY